NDAPGAPRKIGARLVSCCCRPVKLSTCRRRSASTTASSRSSTVHVYVRVRPGDTSIPQRQKGVVFRESLVHPKKRLSSLQSASEMLVELLRPQDSPSPAVATQSDLSSVISGGRVQVGAYRARMGRAGWQYHLRRDRWRSTLVAKAFGLSAVMAHVQLKTFPSAWLFCARTNQSGSPPYIGMPVLESAHATASA
ncbi:unnamed protein product, partial [Scytosiphon promiscuus]